ncbi:FGGY-family carbohydrate kinase [Pseudoprimorskyibacter insulae]|uniref:L-xylulose/3-keto-L-gulonate kinase n=1 Tax=Pseudoprimorskyibacter insulae TaxID=1695997 RepID=A0A2R8B0H5_9RHOB|nr:FGGY-family carbohydrate kinase [Pseudoprimorskyibacter insulae]SPF81624.1 L-xylulose/3-keto-L-gulonate kinase [Pseudoprimorskyibacter insulae]
MKRIAVIDVGKTNAKLALVDGATLEEVAVLTRPNRVRPSPPWPHFELEGHWTFFLDGLRAFHADHGVDAISITTHGASATLIGHDGQALPMLDYEHTGPDVIAAQYDAIRPSFAETGSPRLPMGLNVGAQLHWMLHADSGLRGRIQTIVTYPQYWGYRLTGVAATDVTSLGCHTDLWNPHTGQFSGLVDRLGIRDLMAPARRSSDVLGPITASVATATGLAPDTPVVCGIHDSNASLYPHLLGRSGAFSVVSTGTWVIAMAMNGSAARLDPARDTLVNVNALGDPVPTARFMGGREFELIRAGRDITVTDQDRTRAHDLMLMPAVEPGTGPFAGHAHAWSRPPSTPGEEMVALSWYLALMTDTCLGLTGASGPTVIEGPFARNADYLSMLAAIRPAGVEVAASSTGTSVGAALLCLGAQSGVATRSIPAPDTSVLQSYADRWRRAVAKHTGG